MSYTVPTAAEFKARHPRFATLADGTVTLYIADAYAQVGDAWSDVDGPTGQFNQTMVVQAPAGVTEADVAMLLQALLDRHAMLRVQVDGGWSLRVPAAGAVDAGDCLRTVDELTEAVVLAARERLNPAAGVMLSALWVAPARQLVLIIHHLAVDGVSWRILLEDLNVAWLQSRSGQPLEIPASGTSFQRWAQVLAEHASAPEVVAQADVWRQVAATPALLPAVDSERDTFATAGQLSVTLDDVDTVQTLASIHYRIGRRGP